MLRRGLFLIVLLSFLLAVRPSTVEAASSTTTTTPTTTVGPPTIAPSGGNPTSTGGTVNYGPAPSLPVPNGSDPECKVPGITLEAQRACVGSGSTIAPFPTDNFGIDVHVDASVTDPGAWFPSFIQNLISWIWGMIVTVIGWVFSALGMAFGFNLFGSDRAGRIPGALHGISGAFTTSMFPFVLAIGGCYALFYWIRHQEGKAIGHMLTMIALMVIAAVLIIDPVGLLGGIDRDSSAISGDVLSVFSTGHDGGSGSYGSAEPGLWQRSVERSWCALEFGKDTTWCLAPIDSQTAGWRSDVLAHISKADQNSTPQIQQDERRRLLLAKTNGELWLAFPPNDDARNGKNDNWTLYHHLLSARPDLAAIRGSGGIGSRSGTFVLILLGLMPFVLVLGYIVIHLVAAAIFFVLLLLLAPVVIFAPAFGERGQRAFAQWAGGLGVSLFLQIGYAACLGLLLLVSGLLTQIIPNSTVGWLFWALLWAIAWMHRQKILYAFTLGAHQQAHSMIYRRSFRREQRVTGALRGTAGAIGSGLGSAFDQQRWRKPGEWAKAPNQPETTSPARVPSWQSSPMTGRTDVGGARPVPAVIDGHAETLPRSSEPPALPRGEA